jgi:hypothetical protein
MAWRTDRAGGASEAQAGRSPGTPTGRGRRRAASTGGLKGLPPGWPCLVSCRAPYGIGTRSRNSPNRIHRTASIGRGPGLVAGCHRRWQPAALMEDVRSLFRSGTRAAYPPAGGCGPSQSTSEPSRDVLGIRRLHVLVASPLKVTCHRELCETAGENVTVTKHGFESRWGHTRRWTLAISISAEWPWRRIPSRA